MKLLIVVIVTVGIWLLARETLWRLDKLEVAPSSNSHSGGLVANAYNLDEGGGASYGGERPAPYGIGVYVRHAYMPLQSLDSTLVFASYCGPTFRFYWQSSEELIVECEGTEPPKLYLGTYGKVKITYHAVPSQGGQQGSPTVTVKQLSLGVGALN